MLRGKLYEVRLIATYSNGSEEDAWPLADRVLVDDAWPSATSKIKIANSRTHNVESGKLYICYQDPAPKSESLTLKFSHRFLEIPNGTVYADPLVVTTSAAAGTVCPDLQAEAQGEEFREISIELRSASDFSIISSDSSYFVDLPLGGCFFATSFIHYRDGRRYRLSADARGSYNDPFSNNGAGLGSPYVDSKGTRPGAAFFSSINSRGFALPICRSPHQPATLDELRIHGQDPLVLVEATLAYHGSRTLIGQARANGMRLQRKSELQPIIGYSFLEELEP